METFRLNSFRVGIFEGVYFPTEVITMLERFLNLAGRVGYAGDWNHPNNDRQFAFANAVLIQARRQCVRFPNSHIDYPGYGPDGMPA